MLRNEDRLYHIVVSFPSICANQFLILKFRRNEAICCLIGFSIGIGCCLMYRWIRNTFFSLEFRKSYEKVTNTSEQYTTAGSLIRLNNNANKKNNRTTCHHLHRSSSTNTSYDYQSNLLFDTSWPPHKPHSKHKKSNRNSNSNHRDSSYMSSRASSKHRSFDYYSNSSSSKSQSQSRFSSSYNLNNDLNNCYNYDDPLNDVYQNLAKFLNKQFCKNFKLRYRANLNRNFKLNKNNSYTNSYNNQSINSATSFGFFNKTSSSLFDNKSFNLNTTSYASFSSVKPQKQQSNINDKFSNTSNHNNLDSFFDDDKSSIKRNDHIDESSNVFDQYDLTKNSNPGEIDNKLISNYQDGASPFHFNLTHLDEQNNNYNNNNNKYDNISIDSFQINDELDDDPLSDSTKLLFPPQKSVDKSLEEALHHIDMLKEDMNHLCQDIDTLYNTKYDLNLKSNILNVDYESKSQIPVNKYLLGHDEQNNFSSYNSSLVNSNSNLNDSNNFNQNDLYDDDLNDVLNRYKLSLQSNQLTKCSCIYSNIINILNLETNKNNNNRSKNESIYYDDKYAQTNIDNFLSSSISTSTSTSTSFSRFKKEQRNNQLLLNNKFTRRRYFLTNKYTKKPNGLYILSTSPSMTTSSSLNYCSLSQKRRVTKRNKTIHR